MNWSLRAVGVSLAIICAVSAWAQAADGFWTRQGPEATRASLTLDASLRRLIESNTGHEGKRLGYSYEQMLGFPPFEYRLRTLENLFRDVMAPAEFGGLMGDNLIAKAGEPAQLSYLLWSQLDARAAREWAVPKDKADWGVPWIPKGTSPLKALELALSKLSHDGKGALDPRARQALLSADDSLARLVARIVIGSQLAAPYLRSAHNMAVLQPLLRPGSTPAGLRKQVYDYLVSPYLGDVNDDTIIVAERQVYDTTRTWDANYSAFGGTLLLRHFDAALAEFEGAPRGRLTLPAKLRIPTPLGPIEIAGTGSDSHAGGTFLTLDLGGNDRYGGLIGAPASPSQPISLVLDLGGDDLYDGTGIDGNVGCGLFGIGMVYDRAGNDRYRVKNGGIGFGLYGTGMVIDRAGNDTYDVAKGWGQGAAYAGVGLLLDSSGSDRYRSICMSMGFGGTLGVGTLLDIAGNDDYLTADTGNDSKVWGKTVSMSMGCGYGRRCDSGDGQNQGGGFGILVDAAGDDKYHTSIFSLGSGYWWGAGIFEDRAGDDTYRCTHYSMGSGAHFALGSFVDLAGDDRYNDRPDAVERWGAIGRDGSIAVCIDGDGDDVWGNLTGGHADLNSYALFWDRRGDDVYKRMQPFDPAQMGNRPFGSAAVYPPMRNFRDLLPSVGIFLDTGGADTYPPGMTAAENSQWQLQPGPLFWGFGADRPARQPMR